MRISVNFTCIFVLLSSATLHSSVHALALAEMELNSSLNQPLEVKIKLLSFDKEELNNLEVNVSRNAGLDRYSLPVLKHKLMESQSGHFLLITSDDPIKEPIVNFSVKMNWSAGRILREYSLLIDPQY